VVIHVAVYSPFIVRWLCNALFAEMRNGRSASEDEARVFLKLELFVNDE
jgi:hypothetical protein